MPVRIYEIAKKLGIDNKQVLAKAQELGIPNAKTPSSSLDKITAEYLENEVHKGANPPAEKPPQEPAASDASDSSGPKLITTSDQDETDKKEPEKSTDDDISGSDDAPTQKTGKGTADDDDQAPKSDDNATESAPTSETPDEKSQDESAAGTQSEPDANKEDSGKTQLGAKVGFIKLTPGSSRPRPEKRGKKDKKKPGSPAESAPGGGAGAGTGANRPPQRGGDQPPAQQPGGGQRFRDGRPPYGQQQRGGYNDRGNRFGGGRQGDFSRGGRGNDRDRDRDQRKQAPQQPKKPKVNLPDGAPLITMKPPIMVRNLAEKLDLKPFQLISDLMQLGVFVNVSQSIDEDTAIQVCAKHNHRFESEKRDKSKGYVPTNEKLVLDSEDKEKDLEPRAPVITIMGHVDHGKTTLLDFIRKSNVVSGEDGGITQHIGAYSIEVPNPENQEEMKKITFLDTPGHAAFSAMRARGADVTDIVILVCAADDGIMPQTREALNHAKAAGVPIIIAVNKCDSPKANAQKVRQEFQGIGMAPEEWGGDTIFVDVSALKGDGVPELLTMILLQAEILELKANPNRSAVGNVVESSVEQGGPAATVLVRKGTLKVGDVVVCGTYWGKVRALIAHDGSRIREAGPSTAVKLLGLNGAPDAGTEFHVVKKEKEARTLVEERILQNKESSESTRKKNTLESFFNQINPKDEKILNLIVKSDTQGSAEAIVESLEKIESDLASAKIIHSAVGSITESDVLLASTSEAIVMGFHTKMDSGAAALAKREGVQIRQYTIIYELIDDVKDALTGLLEPELKEVVTGQAEVRQVFSMSKGGTVAGCYVRDGKFTKGKVRVIRNGETLHEGVTQTLRRFQDDVNEVRNGMECGIRVSDFSDFQEGDIIESFNVEKVARKL